VAIRREIQAASDKLIDYQLATRQLNHVFRPPAFIEQSPVGVNYAHVFHFVSIFETSSSSVLEIHYAF
jgi:hypothetical protein